MYKETICALATGSGGAIAIIRMSGDKAFEIANKFITTTNNNIHNNKNKRTIKIGEFKDNDTFIDNVVVVTYKGPFSYTGEDIVEISCHASPYIISKILECLTREGATIAKRGEFTLRAFLNGKCDLSQAEAVADIIAAKTKLSHSLAIKQFKGNISNEINILRQDLINFVSLIELEMDFGEEDIEFASRDEMITRLNTITKKINSLLNNFCSGNSLKEGFPVAIIGPPNVGKSTLLNLLLNENKAIVSEIPGTTRDIIEDTINIDGILFRFIDTAGIRHTTEKIEAIGIERSIKAIEKAEIIILLFDATSFSLENIKNFLKLLPNIENKKIIYTINKIDKSPTQTQQYDENTVFISAKYKTNIDTLKNKLCQMAFPYDSNNELLLTNIRHYNALKKANDNIIEAIQLIQQKKSIDVISVVIRSAIHNLAEVIGEVYTDDILNNIFSNFCIGK